jgi:hypothetical protein
MIAARMRVACWMAAAIALTAGGVTVASRTSRKPVEARSTVIPKLDEDARRRWLEHQLNEIDREINATFKQRVQLQGHTSVDPNAIDVLSARIELLQDTWHRINDELHTLRVKTDELLLPEPREPSQS